MKYKVGDKVRIKSLQWYNENKDEDGRVCFKLSQGALIMLMSLHCDKTAIIISGDKYGYRIDVDNARFIWQDWMFEK